MKNLGRATCSTPGLRTWGFKSGAKVGKTHGMSPGKNTKSPGAPRTKKGKGKGY